ncbi:hypothetical protein SAMN02745164_00509 [Marinitoga hydrogenitolerans DSM 16785]|uniref:Bacteriophage lambda head decoration protein D n=1 Tax=Marinitoga hydrogenitolerans (strain DSM 16785 / JCM 12826 / AT1271) TaxID=1122195 RepID=A0A1M4TTW3_MARH1|nr:hypothetical protein [Marinitoga hydrogenitolerans]SHE47929.1 hypothetical protein SAMN02745164_00509 [Marinitoga hydrogenitolerans DSM 16785]
MLDRKVSIVPVDVTTAIPKGSIVEYNSTNQSYAKLSAGTPAGILAEDVAASQIPAQAAVIFFGVVYEDELDAGVTVTEDLKAQLRQVGIFLESREQA